MFTKIGSFLDSCVKGLGGWWVDLRKKSCGDDKSTTVLFLLITWLAVCFGPIVLFLVHKFVFYVWLSTFTSYTPFADWQDERRARWLEKKARKEQALHCIYGQESGYDARYERRQRRQSK